MTTTPYGSWISPITATDLAATGHPVWGATWVGDDVWWLELRVDDGGRFAVRRRGADGQPVDVLPHPWDARTRVHEYGGGAWAVTEQRTLVFAELTDQRLWALPEGATEPSPLTPAPASSEGGVAFRFGELSVRGTEVIAIRETHRRLAPEERTGTSADTAAAITRDVVAVPLDGSAADDASRIRSVVGGSHFLAAPRFSPDGSRIAWIAWEHPQMPWDGTELRVADIDQEGRAGTVQTLAGSTTESVLQPEWVDDATLTVLTDASGWWNLERIALDGTRTRIHTEEAEYGGPLWMLGSTWYTPLDDGRILALRTLGEDSLVVLDPTTDALAPAEVVPQPFTAVTLLGRNGNRVLVTSGSSTTASGLRVLDLATGDIEDVRLNQDALPDARYLPIAESRTFASASGRPVHTIVYPPRNPDHAGPEGELPPFIAFVHGGPTSRSRAESNTTIAYFTSRGIGVVDVNYGGSTGYGRAYRDALRGQWGVVDVEDTVAAVLGLAEAGLADRTRLAIRGGSAGGWTVLASLTFSDVFAAGASYFGVSELAALARDTHDFESRYTDGLVGPLPEAEHLYRERAPLHNVSRLRTPVLLLQGLDDPIVPPSQAEMFRDALAAAGIPHAYRAYPGESHGFRRTATIIDATESELSFYGQIMGFTTPDVPTLVID
ncbi:prolyl oligopeptidase family serine peptidase [Curtobacterium sp. MCBD17_030]|uniref:S9 family peptidase n=1 Tax=Curtobacterium sp. MCBD17_030 TaxID=2175649 RepID=UPI000D9A6BFE|nr:prolyl oligopeptidase family serine peptidase [Curtobacterium sp. MCBD17_030]PYY36428.1 S9 family peptidase [Curtobacterium sp. MCBD17_030]